MLNATAGMHGKLHSQQARLPLSSDSEPASPSIDGRRCLGIVTTRPRIDERRRWRKHFSPDCSLAGASPAAVEASAPLSGVRPSVPLLPRRGGVSFRAGEPTVLFREKVDGVKLCLVFGPRSGRSRWLCPPRYGNCTSKANLRVLRFNFPERHKSTRWFFLLTAIIFLQNGLVGRHLSSSPRDPAARILIPIVAKCNHLADQKT